MQDLIWTEKYRPKTLAEYYINKPLLDRVKEWLEDLKDVSNPEPKPFLILYGTAGVGKTTLAHLLLQKHGYEIIECNASDTRSKKQIRDMIGGISGVSVAVDSKNRFKKTAIIMDEIDGLNGATESSGIQELIDIIITKSPSSRQQSQSTTGKKSSPSARSKEHIKWVCPVICTSNSIKDKKIQTLLKYGMLLRIDKPTTNDLNKLISRITKAEGFHINNAARDDIINRANGDYRQLIHLCNANYNKLHSIKLQDVRDDGNDGYVGDVGNDGDVRVLQDVDKLVKPLEIDIHRKEDETRQALIRNINDMGETPLDKINYFLTNKTSLDIIEYFCSGDSNLYYMNFYNNIIPVLSSIQEKTKEPKNKDTFLKVYRNLACTYQSMRDADLMNNSIFIDKNWDLLDYFDLLSVAKPANILHNANSAGANISDFRLTHHTQYNFMRQEQVGNKKLVINDYFASFQKDIASVYYDLKRFQNDNQDLISSRSSKSKRKTDNPDEAKYILDKSYCKIMDKITELLN
jgi:DNA polymerase III delta prime subunit